MEEETLASVARRARLGGILDAEMGALIASGEITGRDGPGIPKRVFAEIYRRRLRRVSSGSGFEVEIARLLEVLEDYPLDEVKLVTVRAPRGDLLLLLDADTHGIIYASRMWVIPSSPQ